MYSVLHDGLRTLVQVLIRSRDMAMACSCMNIGIAKPYISHTMFHTSINEFHHVHMQDLHTEQLYIHA
jgi:hypothetical protein